MKSHHAKQGSARRPDTKHPPELYEIMVQEHLDNLWGQWFEGMKLSNVENGESGAACTLIRGYVADQAELHGLLIKIRDLNLTLLSLRRVHPGKTKSKK